MEHLNSNTVLKLTPGQRNHLCPPGQTKYIHTFQHQVSSAPEAVNIYQQQARHTQLFIWHSKVQQITLTCCHPLFSRSQYLVIPPNCSGPSQVPLSTDPSNYSVCAEQRPHRTSPHSNYVFTGTRSRRWGIWVILSVRSAARLKIPQNRTLIERQIETGGSRLEPVTFSSQRQHTVKSCLTGGAPAFIHRFTCKNHPEFIRKHEEEEKKKQIQ